MAKIELKTEIRAPLEICFDLARSIDLHMEGTEQTGEKAVAGVTSGLIGMGEEVTWRAKHFGVWQNLTSKITAFDRPVHFRDTMQKGAFKRFDHDHYFEHASGITVMTDVFDFESPLGVLGLIADNLVLKSYLERMLKEKNEVLKKAAESCPEKYIC